jgi:hypothetical protein
MNSYLIVDSSKKQQVISSTWVLLRQRCHAQVPLYTSLTCSSDEQVPCAPLHQQLQHSSS